MDKKELLIHMIAVADGLDELGLIRESSLLDHMAGKVKEIYAQGHNADANKTLVKRTEEKEQPIKFNKPSKKQSVEEIDAELYALVYDLLETVMKEFSFEFFEDWEPEDLKAFKHEFVKDLLSNVGKVEESQLADFLIYADKEMKSLLRDMLDSEG